ncbi:hypothetical protein NU195Hw_g7084t1 [Hortaea werneckii]
MTTNSFASAKRSLHLQPTLPRPHTHTSSNVHLHIFSRCALHSYLPIPIHIQARKSSLIRAIPHQAKRHIDRLIVPFASPGDNLNPLNITI